MTKSEMVNRTRVMLGEDDTSDELLSVYLDMALDECVSWEYQMVGIPDEINTSKYDILRINAVVFGISVRGAEGETQHTENGIARIFKYADMADYIHRNLPAIARIR